MAIEYNDSTITYNASHVTYTGSITRSLSLSDVVGLTDSVLKVSNFVVSIVDSSGLTDNLTRSVIYSVALADSLSTTENIAIEQIINQYISDVLGLSDNVNISRIIRTEESDTVGISDTTTNIVAALINSSLSDSIGISDISAKQLNSYRAVVDSQALNDSITISVIRYRNIQDSIGITDFLKQFNREKDKNITAIFDVKNYKPHFIGIYSGITTSEQITTDTAYSATDVTYNDLTEIYSGVIMSTAPGKTPSFVRDVKPNNLSIGEKT